MIEEDYFVGFWEMCMKDVVEFDEGINGYLDKMRKLVGSDGYRFNQVREQCLSYLTMKQAYYEGIYEVVSNFKYKRNEV